MSVIYKIMSRNKLYTFTGLILILFLVWLLSGPKQSQIEQSELTKIVLRDVGHTLLLSNQDSTSLVLPILQLKPNTYQLSFQKELEIEPSLLVSSVKSSFNNVDLPQNYRVEVIQCLDDEVAYSYQVKNEKDSDIIACSGRALPVSCYQIKVQFIGYKASVLNNEWLWFVLIISAFLGFEFFFRNKKTQLEPLASNNSFAALGRFKFYPEQNKLVKEAEEISLSKKECELLVIFMEHPNQIIKRDVLTKKVWEDHGVIVGRSLDTYISKLRKKLKDDDTLKLTNVHGVGYKLEVGVL